MCSYVAPASYECTFIAYRLDIDHHHSPTKMLRAIAQGLSPTSSPLAKSQEKPGCLRPIIAIAMAQPRRASFGVFANGELVGDKPCAIARSILVGEW